MIEIKKDILVELTNIQKKEAQGVYPKGLSDHIIREGREIPSRQPGKRSFLVDQDWFNAKAKRGCGRSVMNAAKNVAHAAKSIAKTTARIDRVSDEEFNRRLDICKQCPSGFVTLDKSGDVKRCGKIDDIYNQRGEKKPCGCILTKKARDQNEHCPMGHW